MKTPTAIGTALLAVLLATRAAYAEPTTETGQPVGTHGKIKAAVLVIHGGNWTMVGRRGVASMRRHAKRFNRRGYLTYNFDYRRGAAGFADTLHAYDRLRRHIPAGTPICAMGSSSGGHL